LLSEDGFYRVENVPKSTSAGGFVPDPTGELAALLRFLAGGEGACCSLLKTIPPTLALEALLRQLRNLPKINPMSLAGVKGTNASSARSPVKKGQSPATGGSDQYFEFSLQFFDTVFFGDRKDTRPAKAPVPLISKHSRPKQVGEEN